MKSRALGMMRAYFIPVIILIFLGIPCLVMVTLIRGYRCGKKNRGHHHDPGA